MKFSVAGKGLLIGSVGIILTGCSTVVNSHYQKQDMMNSYIYGQNQDVQKEVEYKLREPTWYNTSAVNSGDELMWRLEAGSLNFIQGKYSESINQFKIAEDLINDYDERAKVSARDVGAEAGSLMMNLNAIPYRGFCRDRMALSIYKSLAYLGNGNEDAFRAQLKRLREEQKKVQDDYREFFEQQEAELAAAKEKNPDQAKKTEESANEDKISENSNSDEFKSGLAEVKQIANKGYGNFLNPAAIFLSGLGSIRDENYDNARIDFQRLYEAMPNNPMFKQYYVTVLQKAGREIPAELKGVKPFDFPLNRDCVYVVYANGRGPAFKQIALYWPIMTAWPMCQFYSSPFESFGAIADGKQYRAMTLADMDGIIAQEYRERLPMMITRIVLSTLVKEASYHVALEAARRSNQLAYYSVMAAGTAYRAAMNTADTRSWELLPKEFLLTQFPMPKNREVSILLKSFGSTAVKVQIPAGCRSAIIFVNAPSIQNISCNVLPIKSK